jgi:hypothetical protein
MTRQRDKCANSPWALAIFGDWVRLLLRGFLDCFFDPGDNTGKNAGQLIANGYHSKAKQLPKNPQQTLS